MGKHCDVCSIFLQDDRTWQYHLAGKKHLKRLEKVQVLERSTVVSSLPKSISQHSFAEYFAQYGQIKRKSADLVTGKTHCIKNVKLHIKKSVAHNNPQKSKRKKKDQKKSVIDYNKIKHIFKEDTTFDNQLLSFLNAVQLTDSDLKRNYDCICANLDKIFNVKFPNCKTYIFGSTLTGLGFKKCDLDMYMDIGEPIDESQSPSSNSWNTAKIFKVVRVIMYKTKHSFSKIVSIPKASTPIIKFNYVKTNVSCDLSFKSSLGIYNSKLIKYYISLDSRLKPLIMVIKYWAKHSQFLERISSYALVLLIIFYLQQPSVNIIPPLIVIQNTPQPEIVNGWQVNINENIVLPPIRNGKSIPELLQGFFSFYTTFEFKSHVICPIDGMIHTESEFTEIQNLPPYMDRYKAYIQGDKNLRLNTNTSMCIQDPISLNRNVTANIQDFTLHAFIKYCAVGFEICIMSSKNDYRNLLKSLFTTVLNKNAIKNKLNFPILKKELQQSIESNTMETCMETVEKKNITHGN